MIAKHPTDPPNSTSAVMDSSAAVPNGAPTQGPSKMSKGRQHSPPDASAGASAAPQADSQKTSQQSSANNSVAHSPLASRDSSPGRNPRRTTSSTRLSGSRSRQNSQQDLSPTRQQMRSVAAPGRTPSSRSLSSTTTPVLPPTPQEPQIQAPTPQKPTVSDLRDSPRWPISPRLRSPPPQLSKPGPAVSRRNEQETPAISIQRPSPSPQQPLDHTQHTALGSDTEESQLQSGLRTPARGALETVQEVSLPNSPSPQTDAALMARVGEKLGNQSDSAVHDTEILKAKPNVTSHPAQEKDSGSETGGARPDILRPTSVPPAMQRQSSAMSSKQAKTKTDNPSQNMTVETETVASVPQVALNAGSKADGANTTLKAKPSTETIKPRKEKKKTSRKQPAVSSGNGENKHLSTSFVQRDLRHPRSERSMSVVSDAVISLTRPGGYQPLADDVLSPRQGMTRPRRQSLGFQPMNNLLTRHRLASSKADIFEAKIASAVDEANTSDSEETFVYDSNPPDGGDRSTRRFHSRTPSTTSMASQADRQRTIYSVMEGGPTHGPKKGMKFVNTLNNNGGENLNPEDDGKGTGRSVGGSARGTARHHHHIGRWGRQPGNGHASLFDNESPFPHAVKSKINGQQSRLSSGPTSPRNHHHSLNHKRSNYKMSNYDLDDTTGADDERTPLMGSTRRSGRNRRGPHNLRQAESQSFDRQPSYLNRFAACLVLTMMLLLVITGAIGFMFATSQPMSDIEILSIKNVVTSEQVLMFDLTVKAHNPNIVVVTVDQANLEIFAKSEHAGTDSDWWRKLDSPDDVHALDDPINDPPPDDDDTKPNVLLGRITEFDSPLTFEGSLFHKGTSSSTGEMQLAYPGNGTSGGSERWERIYQNEFDLIVKGVVKYTLPLSARVRSATVAGRTHVKPNSANDPSLKPNITLDT